VDHQPRPGVRAKRSARDRLIRLAQTHPTWALGFQDEVWWSRLAHPALHRWAEADRPLRLVEQAVAKDAPDPKALACYGLLVRWWAPHAPRQQAAGLRFVEGRPVSALTIAYLTWCCAKLQALGKEALLLVWDNASWHVSRAVRTWLRAHNRPVKAAGRGVRIIACHLPIKSPWLNPIEPKWSHGKRKVVEPDGLLTASDLAERVCEVFGCPYEEHLIISQDAA